MRLSAKGDYAVRAVVELAAAEGAPRKLAELASAQGIPPRFLENIMVALRRAGVVQSRRGADGGFRLAQPAARISVADVVRAVEGPLANVQGARPEALRYEGAAQALPAVWAAVRVNVRRVLEEVSVADVAAGRLPATVEALLEDPGAWDPH